MLLEVISAALGNLENLLFLSAFYHSSEKMVTFMARLDGKSAGTLDYQWF